MQFHPWSKAEESGFRKKKHGAILWYSKQHHSPMLPTMIRSMPWSWQFITCVNHGDLSIHTIHPIIKKNRTRNTG